MIHLIFVAFILLLIRSLIQLLGSIILDTLLLRFLFKWADILKCFFVSICMNIITTTICLLIFVGFLGLQAIFLRNGFYWVESLNGITGWIILGLVFWLVAIIFEAFVIRFVSKDRNKPFDAVSDAFNRYLFISFVLNTVSLVGIFISLILFDRGVTI